MFDPKKKRFLKIHNYLNITTYSVQTAIIKIFLIAIVRCYYFHV